VLAVPAAAETDVDGILDDLVSDEVIADPPGAEHLDGGEEAQAAMAELFLAADRLRHAPWDGAVASAFCRVVEMVAVTLPPYGVEPRVWRHLQKRGSALAESVAAGTFDDEEVAAASQSIRDILRDYV